MKQAAQASLILGSETEISVHSTEQSKLLKKDFHYVLKDFRVRQCECLKEGIVFLTEDGNLFSFVQAEVQLIQAEVISLCSKDSVAYFCSKDGKVYKFDCKSRKESELFQCKQLQLQTPGDSVLIRVNLDASKILLAHGTNLVVFNATNNSQAVIDLKSRIKCAEFSTFKFYLIAVGTEEGDLCMVDLVKYNSKVSSAQNGLFYLKNAHGSSPVSSVSFSPFNRYLMVSCGYDSKYNMYDVDKLRVVRRVSIASVPSALPERISVHPNGVFVFVLTKKAAGFEGLLYNLSVNGGKAPIETVSVDGATVTACSFGSVKFPSNSTNNSVEISKPRSITNELSESSSPVVPSVPLYDKSVNYMQMFSPVHSNVPLPSAKVSIPTKSKLAETSFLQSPKKKLTFVSETIQENAAPPVEETREVASPVLSLDEVLDESITKPSLSSQIEKKSVRFSLPESLFEDTEKNERKDSVIESTLSFISHSVEEEVLAGQSELAVYNLNVTEPQVPSTVLSSTSNNDILNMVRMAVKEEVQDLKTELRSYFQMLFLELLKNDELSRVDIEAMVDIKVTERFKQQFSFEE